MTDLTPQEQIQHAASALSTIPATLSGAQPPPTSLTKGLNDKMSPGPIRYLDTATAYDLWSEVYDTDGNFLQALDNIEMPMLLLRAISLIKFEDGNFDTERDPEIKAVDLGCGTGRNMLRLLEAPEIRSIVGLELSPKMMEIARPRCETRLQEIRSATQATAEPRKTLDLHFETFNMLAEPIPAIGRNADLLISTLVLEHIPLKSFFTTVSSLLRPGGILVLTNMHDEMGRISQAGFVDPRTGEKIRPTSYAHNVRETVEAAVEAGFELVGVGGDGDWKEGGVKEVCVDEELAIRLGVRGRKWIGVRVWFGGIWRKRGEGEVIL